MCVVGNVLQNWKFLTPTKLLSSSPSFCIQSICVSRKVLQMKDWIGMLYCRLFSSNGNLVPFLNMVPFPDLFICLKLCSINQAWSGTVQFKKKTWVKVRKIQILGAKPQKVCDLKNPEQYSNFAEKQPRNIIFLFGNI